MVTLGWIKVFQLLGNFSKSSHLVHRVVAVDNYDHVICCSYIALLAPLLALGVVHQLLVIQCVTTFYGFEEVEYVWMGDTQDLVEPIVKPFITVGCAGKSHVQMPVMIPQFLWVTGSHPLPVFAPPSPFPNAVVFEEVLYQLIGEERVFTQFVKAVFHIIRVDIHQGRQATDCNVELHVF